MRFPKPIEERLTNLQPKIGIIKTEPQLLGVKFSMLARDQKTKSFDQDITLEFNAENPSKFVFFTIDDENP